MRAELHKKLYAELEKKGFLGSNKFDYIPAESKNALKMLGLWD